MKDKFLQLILVKNEAAKQFEMEVDGQTAVIIYEEQHFTISLLHTEVPEVLEGKGVATAIIEKTLAYLEKNHFRLILLCPFVVAYIKRHPEWKMIVDESVRDKF
ncbi:GNAT family N-acetyltransferase [Ferruginibacter sp.]|nr:N-acetyltransferase [Ferruginibacter sp.]